MKYLIMNNGLKIPQLGTGTNTFGKEDNQFNGKITYDTKELRSAIELGYRLIDTAIYPICFRKLLLQRIKWEMNETPVF